MLSFAIFITDARGETLSHHLRLDYKKKNLKAICLLLREGIKEIPEDIFRKEPPFPTVLGNFARTAGIFLIVVLTIIIVII